MFHFMSFNSSLPHWITNQCVGAVVSLPQTSHRNSLIVVIQHHLRSELAILVVCPGPG